MTESPSVNALENLIAKQQAYIGAALAPYEATTAIQHWLNTLRGIEELINLPTVAWNDEAFKRQLYALPVLQLSSHVPQFKMIRERLLARFGEPFVNRFTRLVVQGSAIATGFMAGDHAEAAEGFLTLGAMIGYFQSRRRHLVGLLHFMPHACRGSRPVAELDTLNIFLPLVEAHATPMMGAQYALLVKLAQERLGMIDDTSVELAMLDKLFLEPDRASIIEMPLSEKGRAMLKDKEPLAPDRLFSAAELRNDILFVEAYYAEFDLRESEFGVAASLVRRLSKEYVERDYWIQISPKDLATLTAQLSASSALVAALTCGADSYMDCLSSYAPLVLVGGQYVSTVTLLSRFMYSWRGRTLERKKRFQIRAGFIFEDQVKFALEKQGFEVQDIVRINRQEFDVVTLRNGTIWNVQCKNNFVSLDAVDSDAVAFSRYNRSLVRSYEKALQKELKREHLLTSKLAIDRVQHMVVSRFPVVTDNPRIIVFNRISEFAGCADAILGAQDETDLAAKITENKVL